jgi:hypothetical protein
MPADQGSREDWLNWGRYLNIGVLLIDKSIASNSNLPYVLIPSDITQGTCFMGSNADISSYELVQL